MKTIFFILLFIHLRMLSQVKYSLDYNVLIDFNGKSRVEHDYKGTWYFSSDSILVQKYDLDSLVYNVTEINGRHIYYENDFDETQKELLIPSQVGPQFKVDISGTEFIFLKHELLNDETSTT